MNPPGGRRRGQEATGGARGAQEARDGASRGQEARAGLMVIAIYPPKHQIVYSSKGFAQIKLFFIWLVMLKN